MLDFDLLQTELSAACADAGIEPGSTVVFLVDSPQPAGTTPMAYLHPAGFVWRDTVAVFQAVGAARAGRYYLKAHRLAVWGELPGLPSEALGPMLRHELEHARRWERSGTRFFEADDLLRLAVHQSGGDGYAALPSELEANAASKSYAARTLTAVQLAALRSNPAFGWLFEGGTPPPDVVEATLAELERRTDWGEWIVGEARVAYVADVRLACASWDETNARLFPGEHTEPRLEVVPV